MHHEDYTEALIKMNKSPLTFIVVRAWKVRNPTLESWFQMRKAYMRDGQVARIVMLKVLPGRSKRMEHMMGAVMPTPGYDSHSSPKNLEWYLFDETQCCPTHVIDVKAISNKRTEANDA
eukprot:m51a1_g7790 hypothetical protein (119) ;mRNA; f:7055-7735